MMPTKYRTTAPPNPSFLSSLLLSWLYPLFRQGFTCQSPLETNDLYEVGEDNKAGNETQKLEEKWNEEKSYYGTLNHQGASLLRAVWCCYRKRLMLSALYTIIESASRMAQALLIGLTVTGLADDSDGKHRERLKFYVPALCVMTYASIISLHREQLLGKVYGMHLRIALTGLVYKKALRLTETSLAKFSTGHVINIVSNDVCKFDNFFRSFHHLWLTPLELLLTTYLEWQLIGWLAVAASIYMLLLIPLLVIIGRQLGKLHLSISSFTDQRVRITGEILTGIRAIKMNCWEDILAKIIGRLRKLEMKKIRWFSALKGGIVTIYFLNMAILTLLLYTGLVLQGKLLTVQILFTTMALYSNIKHSLCGHFGLQMSYSLQGRAALKRVQEFLILREKTVELHQNKPNFCYINDIEDEAHPLILSQETNLGSFSWLYTKKSFNVRNLMFKSSIINEEKYSLIESNDERIANTPFVRVENVCFSWNGHYQKPCLKNISFLMGNGELLAVTGPVGCGKSSLLLSILGDIKPSCGKIIKHGKVAYTPQISWIFSGTIRENILFGASFEPIRYLKVVTACQLLSDLESFPKGDLTLVGERGITLSGGQRTRICLARSVYFNADIYLLDDPFSALDIKTGKQLFEQCIKGLLKSCIVILVTHHLSYLKDAQRILLMKQGGMVASGSFQEIQKASSDLLNIDLLSSEFQRPAPKINYDYAENDKLLVSKGVEKAEEKSISGSIPLTTYWRYFRTGNSVGSLLALCLLLVTSQVTLKGSEWWMTKWSEMSFEEEQENWSFNFSIFASLIGLYVVLTFMAGVLHNQRYLNSNKRLHDKMIKAVMQSPVQFFHTNPLGRIQNRFSKDLGYMDEELPSVGYKFVFSTINCIGSVFVIAVVQYWAIIAALPLLIIFLVLGIFYVKTARELKRLEASCRSPLYSHINETIQGLVNIQQFKAEERFIKEFYDFQDEHTRAWFLYIAGGEWLGLNAELLSATFLTAATIAAVITSADAGFTGLALYSAVNLTQIIYVAVNNSVHFESLMTSVERVFEYCKLEPEPGYNIQLKPKADWPQEGSILCESLSLRYFDDGPKSLKDVTFFIKAKEKVGIVGQTGSGKSSLLAALFRMPQADGKILIDGEDISTINIQSSRAVISVIPQDPFLFSGELRRNLDPFSLLDDCVLWEALERVQLKEKVQSLSGQLQFGLQEGGLNLSVGERQLVCLARALLQRNKILVIDEATANVDLETDRKIQATIRKHFSECTVLTIAHRLNTVMDSDRVLVLSGGAVVENDAPATLLHRRDSLFAQMVSHM